MSTDKFVIRNEDGKFISVFANGEVIFGDFDPPITTLFDSENEAREFIRKLVIEGKPIKGQLLVFRYGIIPLHDSEHPGCPHCRAGVPFGISPECKFVINKIIENGGAKYYISCEIDNGVDHFTEDPLEPSYGETVFINTCPMCGRNL